MIDATESELGIVRDIFRKYLPGAKIFIFGSRCYGTAKPYSDIDIAFLDRTRAGITSVGRIREEFMNSDLPYRVDLTDLNAVTKELKAIIMKDCRPLKKDPF